MTSIYFALVKQELICLKEKDALRQKTEGNLANGMSLCSLASAKIALYVPGMDVYGAFSDCLVGKWVE